MIQISNNCSILFLDDCPIRTKKFKSVFPWAKTVATAQECIEYLKLNKYAVVFLDHDLGGEVFCDEKETNTGSEVVRWIRDNNPFIEKIIIHSLNHPAAQNMKQVLESKQYNVSYIPFPMVFDK